MPKNKGKIKVCNRFQVIIFKWYFIIPALNCLMWRYIFNLLETKVKEPIPNRYLSTLIGTLTHYTLCIPNSHNPKNFKSSLMGELELDTVYKDFKWWSKIYKTWYLLHIVAWDLGQIGLTTVYQQIRFDRKSL